MVTASHVISTLRNGVKANTHERYKVPEYKLFSTATGMAGTSYLNQHGVRFNTTILSNWADQVSAQPDFPAEYFDGEDEGEEAAVAAAVAAAAAVETVAAQEAAALADDSSVDEDLHS